MKTHIESFRLFELAEMFTIVDQPEWKHINGCRDCGLAFIQLVEVRESCFSRRPPDRSPFIFERLIQKEADIESFRTEPDRSKDAGAGGATLSSGTLEG